MLTAAVMTPSAFEKVPFLQRRIHHPGGGNDGHRANHDGWVLSVMFLHKGGNVLH